MNPDKLCCSCHFLLAAFLLFALSSSALAAQAASGPKQEVSPGIEWHAGPTSADISGIAQIKIPKGYAFADKAGTKRLMELTHNPVSGDEVGAIIPVGQDERDPSWFVVFEFDEVGYVKDDDKASLNADALLQSMKEGTEEGNKERKAKGWKPFHIADWEERPHYDEVTHNLTWAVKGNSDGEDPGVTTNYSVRLLGRRGTMNVDLVMDTKDLPSVVPSFNTLLAGYSYKQSNRYAEFTSGDKIADYGLAALIGGGATAVAIKTGFLAKLWKLIVVGITALWKLIAVAFAALLGFLKRIVGTIRGWFGRKEKGDVSSLPTQDSASYMGPTDDQP